MSVFGVKADFRQQLIERQVLAKSGHSVSFGECPMWSDFKPLG